MKVIEKRETNFFFYFLGVLIFLGFVGFSFNGENGLFRLWQLHQTKKELIAQNRGIKMEILKLRWQQKSLDSGAIENHIRQNLGWTKPNETVWIVK